MCEKGATSSEHVPPRCLFPEKKDLPEGMDLRKSLITVPSCDIHNSHKSDDDEYLLYCLVLSIPSNQVAQNHFLTKIVRAIRRNPSLIKNYLTTTTNVNVENMNTGEWAQTIGCKIDNHRFDKSLDQLSRAIYFHHTKSKSKGAVRIYPNFLLYMNGESKVKNEQIAKMDIASEQVLVNEPTYGENPEVFKYKFVDQGEGMPKFLRLYFYEGNRVTVIFKNEG
jgi:hypothetical protein